MQPRRQVVADNRGDPGHDGSLPWAGPPPLRTRFCPVVARARRVGSFQPIRAKHHPGIKGIGSASVPIEPPAPVARGCSVSLQMRHRFIAYPMPAPASRAQGPVTPASASPASRRAIAVSPTGTLLEVCRVGLGARPISPKLRRSQCCLRADRPRRDLRWGSL